MKYQYKIIVGNKRNKAEFILKKEMNEATLGTISGCDFRLPREVYDMDFQIRFIYDNDKWNLQCSNDDLYAIKNNNKVLTAELTSSDSVEIYKVLNDEFFLGIKFVVDIDSRISSFDYFLRLGSDREIIIGDIDSADLRLTSEFADRDNLVLRWLDGNLTVKSFISNLDIYINGEKAKNGAVIENKTFFNLADQWFYYDSHKIYFDTTCIEVQTGDVNPVIKNNDFNYPLFIRNTRQKIKENNEKIAVLDPPAKPNKPTTNIVTSLLPAIAMLGLTFVLRGVMGSSGSFAIFAVLSMGVGVLTSVASLVTSKRDYRKECKKRKEDYSMYSRRKEEEIIECRNEELENLRETYYSIEEDVKHFKDFDSRLFDRIPEDDDFLDVYLGIGKIVSKRQVDYKHQETMDVEDNITQIPMNLANQYKYIEKAPIVLKLREANVVGVVGDDAYNNILIENIIVDLMARQYYGDIDIYFLMDEEDEDKFSWIRLLPYFNNEEGIRTIVDDNDSKNFIFEYLYKQLSYRESENVGGKHNVILVKKEHGIKSHPISRFIENASKLNTSFIFFEEKEELLPLYCSYIIKLNSNEDGVIYSTEDKINKSAFRFQQINSVAKKMLMDRVTPVTIEDISLDSSLRKSITLFELLNIYEAKDLNVGDVWRDSKIYESMAVPIGINVKDEIVYLNLHEKFDGPHGLVAGTTGSGKSELLQSYILGAAARFKPTEIGFLVIDFKGGGMVNQFKDLPHLLGAITNIDGKAIDRSLKSIKAELLKRQEFFAAAGVNNIDKYIKLYRDGKVSEALPHLIIIVDEFAELKAEQPEFMKELISAARIGRSLGVHLILATQKPSGQVDDQIWSNSRFKICLKVQTKEDSNEVLKSPLAAEIKEPGRAYIQVGNNEIFELFQSGFSGAPEKVDVNKKNYSIAKVEFNGKKTIYKSSEKDNSKNNKTQLEAVVDYINNYCKENGVDTVGEICMPPLPETVVCDDITIGKTNEMLCPIGIYDDPDRQNQDVATIDIASSNTFIVGSSQYGKTNLLADIVKNLASIYSPNEVNIYVFDFASMVLKNLEKLNHVGGVVVPSEDERVKNLFKYLYEQVEYRRNRLLEAGVSSFVSYKEAGHDDLPQIVILVDNLTALKELYFEQEDELLPLTREGLSVGISFVVANAATTGVGYRYLANFAKKIALFNNDKSEYSGLLGRTNLYPDEIPGRALVEIDKAIYECQTYLAFEGEKEINRVSNMLKFVELMDSKYEGMKAVPIPEIPELLTDRFLSEEYATNNDGQLVVGLDYDTVAPDVIEFAKNNCISVCGRENSGKANIIRYIVRTIASERNDARICVFDNYKKKLEDLSSDSRVQYTISTAGIVEKINEIHDEIEYRYNALASEMEYDESLRVIVVNNEDALLTISENKDALECVKKLCSKYKMLNVVVIFGNVLNEQANYGAPEIYRFIKDNANMLFFDDLQLCKIYDFPLSLMREKAKRLTLGDAYHIIGNEVKRIKTPLVGEKKN